MTLTRDFQIEEIKRADKDEKVAIVDMAEYIEYCELLLNDREF